MTQNPLQPQGAMLQNLRCRLNHPVAFLKAIGIVVRFEMIEIYVQHTELLLQQ
ncbi:hypothetical protein D3C81_2337470 [compost metagenome]